MSADPIVDALVAGTARRGLPSRATSPLVAEVLAGEHASAELRLWHAAGARAIERRAGRMSAEAPLALPAAAAEPWAECSPRAAALIEAMLGGAHEALLPEALERLALARRRLPHRLLPRALLVRRPELRARVRAIAGPRGLWLAAQSPAFAWAAAITPPLEALAKTWAEGTAAPRREALEQGRALDAAAARGWLASTWGSEKAEDRALFLAVLGTGLSPADEPFLEAALDDRSARVRAVAIGLLARLPSSALVARMEARAAGALSLSLARRELVVRDVAPEPRDGLPEGAELRALRLATVMACASLDGATARLGRTPAELVALAARTTDASALADGWSRAALVARSVPWAEALWGLWAEADEKVVDRSLAGEHMRALIAVLPPASAALRLGAMLERAGSKLERPIGAFLVAVGAPWPSALTERYLTALLRAQDAVSPRASELMSALAHAVRAIAEPDLAAAAARLPPDGGDGPWRHSIAEALDLIHLRREILEETRA